MKLTLYLDVWPGQDPSTVTAFARPYTKSPGTKRFAFDVTIPDDMINDVDGRFQEVSRPREVEYHKDE